MYPFLNPKLKFLIDEFSGISESRKVSVEVQIASSYLNGRNPPTTQWAQADLYQGTAGISRAMFFVLHGASKLPAQFLPKIPPITVSGYPTEISRLKVILLTFEFLLNLTTHIIC